MGIKDRHAGSRQGFTILELLIVVSVVTLLFISALLILNPAQIFKKTRDATRRGDIIELNKAISLFQVDNPSAFLGSPTVIYLSLSDPRATTSQGTDCSSLNLPALATSGWSYHCPPLLTMRDVDGSGWVPLNFELISAGPPLPSLAVDPVNTPSSSYYAYTTDGSRAQVSLVVGGGLEPDESSIITGAMIIGAIVVVGLIAFLSFLGSIY